MHLLACLHAYLPASEEFIFIVLTIPPTLLQRAIVAVQGKQALEGISREELYRAVEDLCVHKMGARLYDRLKGECARHVSQAVEGLVAQQVG